MRKIEISGKNMSQIVLKGSALKVQLNNID